MRPSLLLILHFIFFGFPLFAQDQSGPGVMRLFSARQYDDYQGETRARRVDQLRKDDWQARDSFYDLPAQYGNSVLRIEQTDLAPYTSEDGYVVYLVPEVAPQFPGGAAALQQYKQDVLGPAFAGPDDEVQKSVYIYCVITADGQVTGVREAQSHYGIIPEDVIMHCLDAVRYMPAWSPGLFNGKPVQVARLLEFSLK